MVVLVGTRCVSFVFLLNDLRLRHEWLAAIFSRRSYPSAFACSFIHKSMSLHQVAFALQEERVTSGKNVRL